MRTSTQLAVRVTATQLQALDEYAATHGYTSRPDAIRAAIAETIKRADDEAIDRASSDWYTRFPETEAEMADAYRLAGDRLAAASINEEASWLEDWTSHRSAVMGSLRQLSATFVRFRRALLTRRLGSLKSERIHEMCLVLSATTGC